MLNYISAELYKVRRRKSTWALLALLLGLESLYILLFAHGECYELLNAFVTTLTLGLPMALLLSALVCSDMGRSGTLKNELSAGLPRSRIYLGKLLSALIVALIALALVVGLCLAAGGLLFRHSDPAQDRAALAVVGYCLAAALPLWVGGLGLAQMLFFLVPCPGAAESLYFVWFVFLDWMASLITWNAQGPLAQAAAALQSLLLSWTFGQLEGVLTRELLAHSWLVGLGWLAVTSSVGVVVFRRRELR